jgi:hypothetical protein
MVVIDGAGDDLDVVVEKRGDEGVAREAAGFG